MEFSELWQRLALVKRLSFSSVSLPPSITQWNGTATGAVAVELSGEQLVFRERGVWTPSSGRHPVPFQNVYRWTLAGGETLRLEHLRFGEDHPVYLFDLVPVEPGVFTSASPHQCRED